VSDSDVSVEYILNFYIVEWYRETVLDVEVMKERYKEATKKHLSQKDIDKYDKKLERIKEKGNNMKEFILGLIDRRYLKKRMQAIAYILITQQFPITVTYIYILGRRQMFWLKVTQIGWLDIWLRKRN
jgi:hypothetical protein